MHVLKYTYLVMLCIHVDIHTAQLVERWTWDRRVVGSSLTIVGVTVLCFVQDTLSALILVHPRKTCPDITEKLLTWT